MRYRVVVTDHAFDSLDIEREILGGIDAEVVDGDAIEDLSSALTDDTDALLVLYEAIDDELLEELPALQVVSRTGIGVDNIDIDAATEREVLVTNVPDYCISEVSDHAMALLLALQRKIVTYDSHASGGGWDVMADQPIHRSEDRVLGLVAFGNIARGVARKASAFGMDVIAHDPYLAAEEITEYGAEPVDELHELLERSDVVSVHPPLTDETRGMISQGELARMNDDAFVINVARGGIVDEDALATALANNEIAGAGIDVFSTEPPEPNDPLLGDDRVIVTPHAAWYSEESLVELRTKAARNVRAVLSGEAPDYPVNTELLDY